MHSRALCVFLALSASTTLAGRVQKEGLVVPTSAYGNRDAVKQIFVDSYTAYKRFAFGHDDLLPLNQSFSDGRNGWGATIIDAMGTMQIMGLDDWFNEAVDFAGKIDFSKSQTNDTVSVFETTIRYLGGLLSAYELSGQKHPILVQKAKEVADKMAFAWKSPGQQIPFGFLNFTTNEPIVDTSNIAEAGTLDLEWFTLSKYTRNDTYWVLSEGSTRAVATIPPPLPGLAAQGVDPAKTAAVGSYVTWGGGSDSYFEYLIKYARLTNTEDNFFADTWNLAVDSSIKFLLRESPVGKHTYLADQNDRGQIVGVSSHLACFHGGNWILGGRLMNNDTIVKIGLDLVDGCWNTYASTSTGIGPEFFGYFTTNETDPSNNNNLTPEQRAFNAINGFYPIDKYSYYYLRPEVLESNFYAWRLTGDTKYLDRAASAVESFNTYLAAQESGGYAGLKDVNNPSKGQLDASESFWFAEVLKYLYLTFDDPAHISLDDYVFNTEAHPFLAPPAKPVYGSGALGEFTTRPSRRSRAVRPRDRSNQRM
ncbi:glycoside hydrolase family 47 protein [Moniliophthora roreri MCA 2997]|uniref:alpha-1,2-Mannosidase n=2 Tax=Moniliophthora roreri TaxID=221103 RepID=V2WG74_MONRO|nr:glycoside hydrolase family 47 protein [Moniliophthora roreri MCA 2997]